MGGKNLAIFSFTVDCRNDDNTTPFCFLFLFLSLSFTNKNESTNELTNVLFLAHVLKTTYRTLEFRSHTI